MKRFRIFLTILILVAASSASMQGQSKAEKDRQKEIEKAISDQKKAMAQQKKDLEQQKKDLEQEQVNAKSDMEQAMKELENLKNLDIDVHVDDQGNPGIYRRGSRTQPFMPNPPMPPDAPRFHFYGVGDEEGTSWVLSKAVQEDSFDKEYSFEVDKDAKSVVMAVNGDCKAGEIRIKILTPQGRTYSDVVIDEFGNYNVRKSFNISDTENQDKTGEWKFQINSDKATGHFRISFQTY